MANRVSKLQKHGVMTLLTLVVIGMNMGCEDRIDSPAISPSEGKMVDVSLTIGLDDIADGAALYSNTDTKAATTEAFSVQPIPAIRTKANEHPDMLYYLDIHQYKTDGTHLASYTVNSEGHPTNIGASLSISLNDNNGAESQLLIIARGANEAVPSLTGKSLTEVRAVLANTEKLKTVSVEGTNINNMPYLLYLPKVKVAEGKLQSPDGTDVRLRLKRLATKLTLDWTFGETMTEKGYTLKEVRLFQVPADYRILPESEPTQWGDVYPSSVSEFVDGYRLKGTELEGVTSKTIWMPANAQGSSSTIAYPNLRTKENVNPATTYAEFVVDNEARKERLYYRAYLGGNITTDFNLLENTDYHWKININKANYSSDNRISLLDQTPVVSTNLQPTANCFMMRPGTNICFNPYKHEAKMDGKNNAITDGWNPYLISANAIANEKQITKVKIIWQTKDNATSGDLVMGYAISKDDHSNLVNLTDGDNKEKARIHVKLPNTQGGNALIAAFNSAGQIVWSWHIWISNYVPQRITDNISYQKAQELTQNGTVHQYPTGAFTSSGGKHYNKVSMDRNLCATAGGFPGKNASLIEFSRRVGFLYYWGRKDPFFGTVDGTTNEIGVLYDGEGYSISLPTIKFNEISLADGNTMQYTIQNPSTIIMVGDSWYDNIPTGTAYQYLFSDSKTLYDPCPAGWKTPNKTIYSGVSTNNAYWYKTDGNFVATSGKDENPQGGRLYNLAGTTGLPTDITIHNTAWFPVTGTRSSNGHLATSQGAGYAGTCTLERVTSGSNTGLYHFYYLRYTYEAVNLVNGNGHLSSPDPFRCVQE